jgi:hypothetical protein
MKYQLFIFVVAVWSVSFLPVFAEVEEARTQHDVWSGYWWPVSKKEIREPLTKYDALTGHRATQHEITCYPTGPIQHWWGLCHAWAASAVLEKEPTQTIRSNRQRITVGDQKGWLAVCHDKDVSNSYGDRYGDGLGSDDKLDLKPDDLWQLLRRYIKEQKIPIIFDLSADTEVWNYPCYAYKIEYKPVSQGSKIHKGTISLWCATDAVSPNFTGLKIEFRRYAFQVEMQGGNIVMGTGQWLGESVNDHPDFAWFPLVVRSSNPEMNYGKVCKILGRQPVSAPPETNVAVNPVTVNPVTVNPVTVNPVTVNPVTERPNTQPVNTPPAVQPLDSANTLTFLQLFALLKGQHSDFLFDMSAERFNGQYREGDLLKLNGISRGNGYLYLFGINPQGEIAMLYPQPGDDNKVEANQQFVVPSDKARYQLRLNAPYGRYVVKAIVSEKLLSYSGSIIAGQYASEDDTAKPVIGWNELLQRILPEDRQAIQQQQTQQQTQLQTQQQAKGGQLPVSSPLKDILGRFAQDEVILQVDPAKNGKPVSQQNQQQTQQQ